MTTTRRRSSLWWKGAVPALLACMTAAAAPALAAPAAPGGEREAMPPPPPPGEDESMREDLAQTIEIYMMARMKRFVGLTDEQERRIVPAVEDLFSSRREANRKRRLVTMKLRLMLEEDEAKDQELSGLIDELEEIDARLHEKEMKVRSDSRSVLSPRQQARFVLFQERFRQEMQERLRRLQQGDGPGGGARRTAPGGARGGLPPRPRR